MRVAEVHLENIHTMVSPDNAVILEGVAAHYLALEALEHTGTNPELVSEVKEIMGTFGLHPGDGSEVLFDQFDEFQLRERDLMAVQQYRGAIHDSLIAYMDSGEISAESHDAAQKIITFLRRQSANNN